MTIALQNERLHEERAEPAMEINAWRSVQRSCVLPLGFIDASGKSYRDVQICPITGFDQQLIASLPPSACVAEVTTQLLARSVRGIGEMDDIGIPLIRGLLVGDREFLLSETYQLTFGSSLYVRLRCPSEDCGHVSEVALSLGDFTVEAPPLMSRTFFEACDSVTEGEIEFRLPTGGDQEALSHADCQTEQELTEELVGRCVENPRPEGRLSSKECERIASHMKLLAPMIDVELEAMCPQCSGRFTSPVDIPFLLLQEIRAAEASLDSAIHTLAFHYHWSESEILSLTPRRRERYLNLLQDELERTAY